MTKPGQQLFDTSDAKALARRFMPAGTATPSEDTGFWANISSWFAGAATEQRNSLLGSQAMPFDAIQQHLEDANSVLQQYAHAQSERAQPAQATAAVMEAKTAKDAELTRRVASAEYIPSAYITEHNEALESLGSLRDELRQQKQQGKINSDTFHQYVQQEKALDGVRHKIKLFLDTRQLFFGIHEEATLDFMAISDDELAKLIVSSEGEHVDGGIIGVSLVYYKQLQQGFDEQTPAGFKGYVNDQLTALTKYQTICCGILMQRLFLHKNNANEHNYTYKKMRNVYRLEKSAELPLVRCEIAYDDAMNAITDHQNLTHTGNRQLRQAVDAFKRDIGLMDQTHKSSGSLYYFWQKFVNYVKRLWYGHDETKITEAQILVSETSDKVKQANRVAVAKQTDLAALINIFLHTIDLQRPVDEYLSDKHSAELVAMKVCRNEIGETQKDIFDKISAILISHEGQAVVDQLSQDDYNSLKAIPGWTHYKFPEIYNKNNIEYNAFKSELSFAYRIIRKDTSEVLEQDEAVGALVSLDSDSFESWIDSLIIQANERQRSALITLKNIIEGDEAVLSNYQNNTDPAHKQNIRKLMEDLSYLFVENKSDRSRHVRKNKGTALMEAVMVKFVLPRFVRDSDEFKKYQGLCDYILQRNNSHRLANEKYADTKVQVYPAQFTFDITGSHPNTDEVVESAIDFVNRVLDGKDAGVLVGSLDKAWAIIEQGAQPQSWVLVADADVSDSESESEESSTASSISQKIEEIRDKVSEYVKAYSGDQPIKLETLIVAERFDQWAKAKQSVAFQDFSTQLKQKRFKFLKNAILNGSRVQVNHIDRFAFKNDKFSVSRDEVETCKSDLEALKAFSDLACDNETQLITSNMQTQYESLLVSYEVNQLLLDNSLFDDRIELIRTLLDVNIEQQPDVIKHAFKGELYALVMDVADQFVLNENDETTALKNIAALDEIIRNSCHANTEIGEKIHKTKENFERQASENASEAASMSSSTCSPVISSISIASDNIASKPSTASVANYVTDRFTDYQKKESITFQALTQTLSIMLAKHLDERGIDVGIPEAVMSEGKLSQQALLSTLGNAGINDTDGFNNSLNLFAATASQYTLGKLYSTACVLAAAAFCEKNPQTPAAEAELIWMLKREDLNRVPENFGKSRFQDCARDCQIYADECSQDKQAYFSLSQNS